MYSNGAEANTTLDNKSTFFLPNRSESDPAGKLIKTPGRVEAAATNPIIVSGVPRLSAKGFKTGFLDIVELRIANEPKIHNVKKKYFDFLSVDIFLSASSV
jgi:hypothetical protein